MADPLDDETDLTNVPPSISALSDPEIDAVLDDPTMSREEKIARMEELRERVIHRDDEEYAPFATRVMDALSMLAQGGHDYDNTVLDDEKQS